MFGLARLMTRYYQGDDLTDLGQQLLDKANADDPLAMLDLAIVLQLRGESQAGLAMQSLALAKCQHYHLEPDNKREQTRLLALMAPGDLMTNMPLEFLCKGAGLDLDILYVCPDWPLPEALPKHDVLIVAICEMERNIPVLAWIEQLLENPQQPVLNPPECIVKVGRDKLCNTMQGVAGLLVPSTHRIDRSTLERLATGEITLASVAEFSDFPIIIRPVDSHAGHGLEKIDAANFLGDYLRGQTETDFFISEFVDYQNAQGQFCKYRVVMINGQPFLAHMAVSEHWMVHYLNAGMTQSAQKREIEAQAMADFRDGFARRHGPALQSLFDYTGLDYFSIDCSQTLDGRLLVFEAGSSMVVHDMDPVEIFPYKRPHMQEIFTAFATLVRK